MAHFTILRSLLELNTQFLKALARRINIVHRKCNVPKPARLAIAVVVWRLSEALGPMVMRELKDTYTKIDTCRRELCEGTHLRAEDALTFDLHR